MDFQIFFNGFSRIKLDNFKTFLNKKITKETAVTYESLDIIPG